MVHPGTSHDQPVVDEGTHPSPSPRERLAAALSKSVNGAAANNRGKFPMAALKFPADGSPAEMKALTVALTEEAWLNIREVYAAARALLADGVDLSDIEPRFFGEHPPRREYRQGY